MGLSVGEKFFTFLLVLTLTIIVTAIGFFLTTPTSKPQVSQPESIRPQVGVSGIINKIDSERKLIILVPQGSEAKKIQVKVDDLTQFSVGYRTTFESTLAGKIDLKTNFSALKVGQRISVLTKEDLRKTDSVTARLIEVVWPFF